jgi:hypothetical protein
MELIAHHRQTYPQLDMYSGKVRLGGRVQRLGLMTATQISKTFEFVDSNGDGMLTQDEFKVHTWVTLCLALAHGLMQQFLVEADAKLKALPATAAVRVPLVLFCAVAEIGNGLYRLQCSRGAISRRA